MTLCMLCILACYVHEMTFDSYRYTTVRCSVSCNALYTVKLCMLRRFASYIQKMTLDSYKTAWRVACCGTVHAAGLACYHALHAQAPCFS